MEGTVRGERKTRQVSTELRRGVSELPQATHGQGRGTRVPGRPQDAGTVLGGGCPRGSRQDPVAAVLACMAHVNLGTEGGWLSGAARAELWWPCHGSVTWLWPQLPESPRSRELGQLPGCDSAHGPGGHNHWGSLGAHRTPPHYPCDFPRIYNYFEIQS